MNENLPEQAEGGDVSTVEEKDGKKLVAQDDSPNSMFMDSAKFEQLWRVASAFSRADIVPDHYKRKPENCMISIAMAYRMDVDPLMMLQSSYIVHGKPGIEAKLAIALINKSRIFSTPLSFKIEGQGKTRSCTAMATHARSGQVFEETVSMQMAEAEGWTAKKGSKWITLPDLMLKYRAAMFFGRLYCPEVLMGMSSVDELEDSTVIDITGKVERAEPAEEPEIIEPDFPENEETKTAQKPETRQKQPNF